jgi:hypothetical protein
MDRRPRRCKFAKTLSETDTTSENGFANVVNMF